MLALPAGQRRYAACKAPAMNAGDIMSRPVLTVGPDAPSSEIARVLAPPKRKRSPRKRPPPPVRQPDRNRKPPRRAPRRRA